MLLIKQQKLIFSFIILLFMSFILGMNGIFGFSEMSNKTKLIYEHPYFVSNRIHIINSNILALHITLRKLVNAKEGESLQPYIEKIEHYERIILDDFDLVYKRYLGNKEEIKSKKEMFLQWRSIGNEEIALKQLGSNPDKLLRLQVDDASHMETLLKQIEGFSDFADNKALTFLHEAQKVAETYNTNIILTLLFILATGVYLAYITTTSINTLITQIKERSKVVDEKNQEIDTLINSITDWIWIVDENAKYTYVSKQITTQLGYNPEELIGKTPFDLMDKDEAQRVKSQFEAIASERAPMIQLRNINRHKNGDLVVIESSGNPIFDSNGVYRGYQGSDRDVTKAYYLQKDIKNQEQMLLAQSRLAQMGELVSMIAHQWRQPLATISAISAEIEIMLEINEYDLSNPEEEKRCVDYMKERHNSIQEQVQHLSQTINDFRDFYKPNQHPVQESLDNSIHKAIRILEPIIRSHTINLQTTLDTKEIQNIFVSRIVQTLVNIIKNAVDAFDEIHQEQPYIHISSYQTSTDNIITIRDNAGGISPENLEHIFDPYFSTKDDKNGTGLGLYMSKIIIEKHHQGSIIASSKNSETTFTITIPRNINL